LVEPFEALEAEVARVAGFLDGLSADEWLRPTRCPPMTVLDLAAHAWRGGIRINEMLDAGAVDEEPEKDGATYFQYDPAAIAAQVVRRAQETSASLDARTFPQAWRGGWAQALGRVRDTLVHEDPVLPGVFGTIRLTEYLRTRCVEVTIHHMDLRDAVGADPDPSPQGLEATCDVLRDLLGTDLRPLGMDDVRFALVGTGRGELTAAERAMLGPLSDSFPLLQ
jgi:uncharacterized protein (TIGR03083 family)